MPKCIMPKPKDSKEFDKYFMARKTLYGPKKEPVWVYLEKQMQENIHKKPYNEKVGEWLNFLRELKLYYYRQSKKQERILQKEVGPPWYIQMSGKQKEILLELTTNIHHDLIEDLPTRTRKALSDLGLIRSIPKSVLMKTMIEAGDDAVVFIWKLYIAIYKKTPSQQRKVYDMDAMILISSLVFIDIEECLQNLKDLTLPAKQDPSQAAKRKEKPRCAAPKSRSRYGMYLEKCKISLYSNDPSPQRGQRVRTPPPRMEKKITLRSDASYERLRMDNTFIDKRMQRCRLAREPDKVCTYKFWEAPFHLRHADPEMADYCEKLKLINQKAPVNHSTQFKNIQFNVGPVVLAGGNSRYLLNNICHLPTGYIPINAGTSLLRASGEYLMVIAGAWRYPVPKNNRCDRTCNCVRKWEPTVMKHLEKTKCTCGHLYDFHHEGKAREKYFYPPTKHAPMWVDSAKVYQMDPTEDFIRESARLAEMSKDPTPVTSNPGFSARGLHPKALLKSFLADLSHTPLVIPHLPHANHLNSLLEWVRIRFKGKLTPDHHTQAKLHSLRRWLWLKHMDFRKRAYFIPMTKKEKESMTWAYKPNIVHMYENLLTDFTKRNKLSQLEQTRLWWSTMKFDRYPGKAFLDTYFTYMPARTQDTYIFNPYDANRTPKNIYKTCPLK